MEFDQRWKSTTEAETVRPRVKLVDGRMGDSEGGGLAIFRMFGKARFAIEKKLEVEAHDQIKYIAR